MSELSHQHSQPTPRWCSCAVPDDEVEHATSGVSRRNVVIGMSAAGVLAAAGWPGAANAAPGDKSVTITIMGTSDLHTNVVNWDYYKDATYSDSAGNAVGLARVASVVNQIRADRGREHTLLFDAGDTIQGTPLGFYYATVEPVTETGATHPMAAQMNALGYDAVALGNHEFNYGLEFLDNWISQMDAPVLAANAVHAGTKVPRFRPYSITTMKVKGRPPVRVGVLGLTNPGVVIWDKANVSGKLEVQDLVEAAARWVPVMRHAGADVVVASAHSGDSGRSSYTGDLPVENAAALVAEQVPGIDAILFGHAHAEVPQRFVINEATGEQVLLSEPSRWGQRLTRMDFTLTRERGCWRVASKASTTLNSNTVPEDPAVLAAVRAQHGKTVAYVNQVVATSVTELAAAESRYRDTPILDYINKVQTDTVTAALAGTPYAGLPVLSIAAPFSRTARFPAGEVKIKDVAGLYIYDNTLEAVVLSGAELRAYLEYSAKYFRTLAPGAPVDPAVISDPAVPDYNYDTFSGVDYDIDISRPVGQRITSLTHPGIGTPVADGDQFVVAVNNYRRSGGGNFPGIVKTQVYNAQQEIRQLLIDWAQARGVIDPVDFYQPNWRLVREGVPVF